MFLNLLYEGQHYGGTNTRQIYHKKTIDLYSLWTNFSELSPSIYKRIIHHDNHIEDWINVIYINEIHQINIQKIIWSP